LLRLWKNSPLPAWVPTRAPKAIVVVVISVLSDDDDDDDDERRTKVA
jgi:hypothetical protein